ncbi:fungal-specific transcription factor domain-containing protein [Collybia nuda]|uniref:Fungal-specific transcription factor domain-containing protein n=1 Tax=Collybia nuda TaxID=64659 RepID=A0A9P5Y7M2_9AGAR|nr:fungal-specific transcription factor domain-containing protein [Collybia nuda]
MSSYDDEDNEAAPGTRDLGKRKVQRACDLCRRKKVRCDGPQMLNQRCTNCITVGQNCTYVEAAKRRGPPKAYLDSLKNRVENLERLLSELHPEALASLDGPSGSDLSSLPHNSIRLKTQEDNLEDMVLVESLDKLSLDGRFLGKSSGAMLMESVMNMRDQYMGIKRDSRAREHQAPRLWGPPPKVRYPRHDFPEEDLMFSLIDLYFNHMNLFLPLLYRPTFDRAVSEGLHLTDELFALNLLLVCAVGSRYSNDPRVLLEDSTSWHSCGWKWFSQVPMVKEAPTRPASLYEIQYYCLVGQYLHASSVPQACWTVVGIGIRAAQDVGAHRRKTSRGITAHEDELWKRAFWVLVCMDRLFSSSCGRPCSIHDEEFDLDMPIECDDVYWEHRDPQQCFKQQSKRPSVITYFCLYIRLSQILATVLRSVYAINKQKILLGFVGPQWEEKLVADLDSALNSWADSVPDHLRWNPHREDDIFFNQSASLWCFYYHIQILVHRPFIPSPRRPVPLPFPSLAICTNAARSCSHVASIQGQRFTIAPPPIQTTAFSSGVVLLLNIWGGKRSGITTDPNKEMTDVHKCMSVLKMSETRWFLAGRLWDILYELASVGELPLPASVAPPKRERDEEIMPTSGPGPGSDPGTTDPTIVPMDFSRNIAGTKRITKGGISASSANYQEPPQSAQPPRRPQRPQQHEQPRSRHPEFPAPPPPPPVLTLPVSSDELGRIPLHTQHEYSPFEQHLPPHNPSMPWYGNTSSGSTSSTLTSHYETRPISDNRYYSSGMDAIPPFSMQNTSYAQMGLNYTSAGQYIPPDSFNPIPAHSTGPMQTHVGPSTYGHHALPSHFPSDSQLRQTSPEDATYAMWSNAPSGFELDDWGTYLYNVRDMPRSPYDPPGGHHAQ